MTLSVQSSEKLAIFFKQLAELELEVEQCRQDLAALYDFEPYAAFCRLDADGDGNIFTIDFYNYLHQNEREHFGIKDC